MKRLLWLSFALAFLTAGVASGEETKYVDWTIVNRTDACAWITVYWGYKSQVGWHIASDAWNRPRFVEAGQGHLWKGSEKFSSGFLRPQIKYRAEMMWSASCSGGRRSDLEVEGPMDYPAKTHTGHNITIEGANGNYRFKL